MSRNYAQEPPYPNFKPAGPHGGHQGMLIEPPGHPYGTGHGGQVRDSYSVPPSAMMDAGPMPSSSLAGRLEHGKKDHGQFVRQDMGGHHHYAGMSAGPADI